MEFWRRKKKTKPKDYFIENGSMFLEELIAESNGISNPIRFFSSHQISKAMEQYNFYSLHDHFPGVIEGRSYTIKKKFNSENTPEDYKDLVVSSKVSNHRNFLKLIGCCLESRSPIVVFENAEYGVLNNQGSIGDEVLPWNVRLKIAKDVAVAVCYLHTAFDRIIIHRDIKPMNVFLDKNWNAKLTGFDVSVTLPEGKTWIEDDLKGTVGYVDPVYVVTRLVTEYTDVFSFGVFMLVLLMGRVAIRLVESGRGDYILNYVKEVRERGGDVEFAGDIDGVSAVSVVQMEMFFVLALRCCKERNEDRPKMIMVAKELKRIETLCLDVTSITFA